MAGRRLDRGAVRVLGELARRRWGFSPNIVPHLVEQLGPIRAVRWALRAAGTVDTAVRSLGAVRAHLVCVVISQFKGCQYTTHGHAYALELHYLRQHDRLFPTDADTMAGWAGLPRAELRGRLRDTLMAAGLHVELLWVDRTLALAEGGQQPIDEAERRLAQLVTLFGTLTAVSIVGGPEPDQAHDPINRDARLKTRLAALRSAKSS
jgi:hypothetical protein